VAAFVRWTRRVCLFESRWQKRGACSCSLNASLLLFFGSRASAGWATFPS